MKNLIISIICLLLLIIPWGIYHRYSDISSSHCQNIIQDRIIPAANSGDWQHARESFTLIEKDWDNLRRISVYFIDTQSLNDVTAHIARVSCYIQQQDTVNTIVESATLQHKLNSLHENEALSIDNLF